MTRKQYFSRVRNVVKHANNNTAKGKILRAELFRVTKQAKFKEKNFQKRKEKYKFREISGTVTRIEKIRKLKIRKRWIELGKPTTLKKFEKANRHQIDFEIEDIEIYFDSP